jgi:short-subunit dehydrogenase
MAFPVSSMYDASKWALEGWSESLSFELSQFGIGIKNIEPGLVTTEIGEKSVVVTHPEYEALAGKFFAAISNPASLASTSEQIAEVVYGAATDGTDTLRYVCGDDAKALYAQRLAVGDEAFRKGIQQMIVGA